MELRPHQVKAVEMIKQSIRKGNKRIMLAAPCSFGKTVLALYLIQNAVKKGNRCMFICDRVKLIDQALNTFIRGGLRVGVIQGQHEMQNPHAPVQIASVQSLMRRRTPDVDFIIIDEAHIHYEYTQKLMERWNNLVFIGLSATPFSKGLARKGAYQDLVVPITPSELFDKGFLTPCDYYGGQSINLDSVKRKSNPLGGTEYDPKDLASRYEKDKEVLVGDAIKNYMRICPNKMAIAFAPSIAQSKYAIVNC
jgi:DNA repair protein RadD